MDDHDPDSDPQALPNPFDLSGMTGSPDGSVLEGLERELHPNSDESNRRPNFPPLCPVISINISCDISPRRQRDVRIMLFGAISHSLVLLFSVFIAILSSPLSGGSVTAFHWWKELLMSLFYMLVFPGALFFCQFWPFYRSCRDDVPLRSHAVQVIVLIVHGIFLIGLPGTGMVGIVYAVAAVQTGTGLLAGLATVASLWHALNFGVQCLVIGFTGTTEQNGALLVSSV